MQEYSIYTEDRDNLESICLALLPAATIIRGRGIWQGTAENSAVIIYITDHPEAAALVRLFASRIKRENNQSAVLVASRPIETELI